MVPHLAKSTTTSPGSSLQESVSPSFVLVLLTHTQTPSFVLYLGGGLLALIFLYFYGGTIVLGFFYLFFPCWCKRRTPAQRRGPSNRVPRQAPVLRLNSRVEPPPAYASTSSLPSFSERDPALPPLATEDSDMTGTEIPYSIPLPISPLLEQEPHGSPEMTQVASPALSVSVPPTTRPPKAHVRGAASHSGAQRTLSFSSQAPLSESRPT